MRRILCLHLPHLATERVRRDVASASDRQQPLVLTRPVGAVLVVEQVCPVARQLGVRPGMSLGQAQAIVPELVALAHESQRDRTTLGRLASWAVQFSPVVEPVAPDTLLVDITGCELLFGGEANIAQKAVVGLTRLGFHARAAVADTVGAACALAVAGTEPLTIVPVGQANAYLAPLSPSALRIDTHVATQLDALGVRSIGDLLTLPRSSLPARFGGQLVRRLQQAFGETFEGVTPHRPEEALVARRRFETPLADGQVILMVAEVLLAEVFAQVRRREAALRRLDCGVYYEDAAPRMISIGLARASRQREHVTKLLAQRLEQVDLTPGITELMLIARETSRYHGDQGTLFEPRDPGEDDALGCLVDRLASRLGHRAVVRPRLVDDHQPEQAFRWVSIAEAGCQPKADARMAGSSRVDNVNGRRADRVRVDSPLMFGGGKSATPLRVMERPVPIRVIALVPDGPPTWLVYRGKEYEIVQACGPQRLETAWWRGPDVRRDYFRVTAETGEQFWVFHGATDGQWYLHGMFV